MIIVLLSILVILALNTKITVVETEDTTTVLRARAYWALDCTEELNKERINVIKEKEIKSYEQALMERPLAKLILENRRKEFEKQQILNWISKDMILKA